MNVRYLYMALFFSALVCFSKDAAEVKLKTIDTASGNSPHILFVNVNNALSDKALADGVEYVNGYYEFNLWTNSLPQSMTVELLKDPQFTYKKFGENAVITVFIERDEKGYSFLNAPGRWAMINMRGLDKDNPSPDVLQQRIRKMLLKGLAHACGVGSGADPHCVMFCDSFTLEGIDGTSATIGPQAFYPLLKTLRHYGDKAPFKR